MRRKSLLTLIIGLLMLAGIGVSQAQTTITLMEWTNQWRYLVTNALPTGWSASNYPAQAGWPEGRAPLAFPAGEAMPGGVPAVSTVLMTNFNSMIVTSFYFRASITITTAPSQLLITGNVVADDGAVIYVNGREVQRVRMPAAPTVINHHTLATGGGEVSTRPIDTFALASSNFVQGVNVIAAEAHQDAHTSSDVVWGMSITAQVLAPIAILTQPEDQTVEVGQQATFSVTATGSNPRYRWYANGVPILPLAGATNATYVTPTAITNMNGTIYHVVVSNVLNSVRSSNAVLTVVSDMTGPLLLQATRDSTNRILLLFNETVLRTTNDALRWEHSISNLNNFSVHTFGTTSELEVTNVFWASRNLRLTMSENVEPGSNYIVCVYNLQDSRTNTTSKDCIGVVAVPLTNNVFSLGQVWHFHDLILDNSLANTNWTAFGFDDSEDLGWPPGWGIASGWFWHYQPNPPTTCSPAIHEIRAGNRTHYYRKKFTVASLPPVTNITLVIRHVIDDGAVFYVNETEVGRVGMPAGPVNFSTRASTPVGLAACNTSTFNVPASVLRVGSSNIMAVEVHQEEADLGGLGRDAAFDAELAISYQRTPVIPALTVTRTRTQSATNAIVTWVGAGWQLQHATSPTGTWANITASVIQGTNRYQTPVPAQGPRRFYRLRNP